MATAAPAQFTARTGRPAAEQVPSTVHRVTLHRSETWSSSGSSGGSGAAATERGAKAQRLVDLFNQLKREPRNYVHCDAVGGPTTVVTFHGVRHVWVAKQSTCTNIVVTRDGRSLPTLLPSKAWTRTVNADLGG